MPGRFAVYQPVYAAHRIATYPLTAGKTPAIRGYQRVGMEGSTTLATKFTDADAFGFVAGRRNGVTVIDIDSPDERLVEEIESRFGKTPLHVLTPSGGHHLYYRHSGESRRIRSMPHVDVLGGGNVVAAASAVPKGPYAIERGSLEDLERLPAMRPEVPCRTAGVAKVGEGQRHNALFAHCMRQARHCDDLATLLDIARTHNEDALMPPLQDSEVVKTARSAWGYEQRGENRYGTRGAWFCTAEVNALLLYQDALVLLLKLRAENLPESLFWITNGWAATFGWTVKRMAAARQHLLGFGYIELERAAFRGSPALFRWTLRPQQWKGGQN